VGGREGLTGLFVAWTIRSLPSLFLSPVSCQYRSETDQTEQLLFEGTNNYIAVAALQFFSYQGNKI